MANNIIPICDSKNAYNKFAKKYFALCFLVVKYVKRHITTIFVLKTCLRTSATCGGIRMGKVKILYGMFFMLLAMSGASLVSAAATIELPITVDEDYTAAKELLDEINKARVNTFGLHELQMDA